VSLLSICQDVSKQLAIGSPTAVAASTDTQARQFMRLANQEGKELARRFDWQILTKEATFTTLAAETQATVTTLATDFLRIIDKSMWNRTMNQRVAGPLSPQAWQKKKASAAEAGFGNWFRIRGGLILFYPTPVAGETIYFEYISKNWCESSGGTDQDAFAADTDVSFIDEEIIKLGLLWRFLASKGADYAEEFAAYERALADIFGPDGGNELIDMTPDEAILGANIPEGSWS
jgi:hypothetical protein